MWGFRGMSNRENTIQIARITASIASGEIAEEAGQQAINRLRQTTGTEDNDALDAVQSVASHALGVGSVAGDVAEAVADTLFDVFD